MCSALSHPGLPSADASLILGLVSSLDRSGEPKLDVLIRSAVAIMADSEHLSSEEKMIFSKWAGDEWRSCILPSPSRSTVDEFMGDVDIVLDTCSEMA